MADRRADIWLSDIRSEIASIRALTRNETVETFAASWAMTRKIHGLGNLLRHEARRIDPTILWSVITDHPAALDIAIAALLDRRSPR